MTTNTTHRRYVIVFIAACTAVLLPVVVLNYILGFRSLGGGDVVLEASRWQEATHGITYAPPLSANRPFKSARLFDRLSEINAIVFGSSTMMGVMQSHFPVDIVVYNFSQTGNELSAALGEAEFMQHQHPTTMKLAVIPLDWALGFIYRDAGQAGQVTIAPHGVNAPAAASEVPLRQQLQDTMSLPRVKNLMSSVVQIARAPSFATAFRATFFAGGSEDYRCVDGTPARDFDTIFRGSCTGFRYDGSATFANLEAVSPRRVESLIASAVVPSSKYAVDLIKSGGLPHPQVLKRLDQLARDIRQSGGRLLLILPPLLPNMERAFLNSPHTEGSLAVTKQKLAAWARSANVVIIDAGQSERFGCAAIEFVDEHHALPSCYARVFRRFWSVGGNSTKLPAGLFTAE
jgi:hypothetical protein